jgi:Na+/H+ antiporter NhaC
MAFPKESDWIQPWDWNLPLELAEIFIILLLVAGIWIWVRAGYDRKNLPETLGRNVEDFAGVTQESNGPIPLFLLLFYLVLALFMIGYPAITLIFDYNY